MYDDEPDEPAPLGVVPVEGRGSLPFALVHGESLVAAASWALRAAGVRLYDLSVGDAAVRESGRDLVVHDPLCPLTPADFLAETVALSRATGAVVVGVRPVTDTVKQVRGRTPDGLLRLGATVDRDRLVAVASPLVLPAAVLDSLGALPLGDVPALVADLLRRAPVRMLTAPPLARRIADEEDLALLATLSEVSRAAAADPPPA